MELIRRIWRYLGKYGLRGIWAYSSRTHNYNLWLRIEAKRIERLLMAASEDIARFQYNPVISIVMPVRNTDLTYLKRSISSVCNQVYPYWELCIVNDGSDKWEVTEVLESFRAKDKRIKVVNLPQSKGIVGATNAALSIATGEFIGFLDHDDELAPHALLQVVRCLNKQPELDVIYSDEDRIIGDRRCEPFFKPDWSPDLMLSMNYIGHFLVIRRKLIEKLGGLRPEAEGSQDYDLVLRVTEKTNRIAHIPEILYHWRITPGSVTNRPESKARAFEAAQKALASALERRRIQGQVVQIGEGRYRIKYIVQGTPRISIIIPTKDKAHLLQRCVATIQERSSYKNYELIIVDNHSKDQATMDYLTFIQQRGICKVISFSEPFNYAKINNFAVQQAEGEYLVFLNNDTEVISPDWLEELLSYAQQKRIGAVGAKLLFPNNTIQHAGVIIGLGGVAGHAFYSLPASDPGYMGLADVTRNCAAVTGACMMLRRIVFEEVGGFDEELDVAYNDVDLCLRIIQHGCYIVWTPHAVLYHHESASRGYYQPERNIRYFCEKWRDFLDRGDPFYNPNLALDRTDFMVKV
ncbi:glycosyltransferase family 2 protein [Caldanaerovirga acetigignens]|uniref:glycosyltransferase family 2 protein n=1 Tax=Caldanaerovirga acetigignens TaxID=447595 RepID=UPI001A7E054D|nr:glycosyltransferase family 2 protein [Caldanaerovirga acetigignens]